MYLILMYCEFSTYSFWQVLVYFEIFLCQDQKNLVIIYSLQAKSTKIYIINNQYSTRNTWNNPFCWRKSQILKASEFIKESKHIYSN